MEENRDPLARRVPSFAQGKRILLVDRDASSLTYISSVLESHSYKVTTIELESVAMSMFAENKDEFDAVMVDMNMKDMTSLEFVRRILLTKNYTPIILMSSMGNEAVVSQALIDGACHFLEKPIPNDQLLQIWQHVHRVKKLSEVEQDVGRGSSTGIGEGATIKEKGERGIAPTNDTSQEGTASRTKRCTGIQIREEGNDCRPATGVELQGIDPKGKNKKVEGEVGLVGLETRDFKLPIGLSMDGIDQLRMEANEKRGCSKRKRPSVDDGVKRKHQRNECSENSHSKGKSPSGEVGSERNLNGCTSEAKQSTCRTTDLTIKLTASIRELGEEWANPKAIQDTMNGPNLTQCQISSHLQRHKSNKTQVQSMSDSREDATTPLLSSRNATAFNISSRTGAPQSQEQQGLVGIEAKFSLELKMGDGRRPGSSQISEREPFPGEKGKAPPQNFPTKYGWQNPIPFNSLSHRQNLVPGTNPFAYAPNTNVPTGTITGEAMPPLAHGARSANPGIANDLRTGHVSSDEGELECLTAWLRNSSNEDDPHIQPFDGSYK
ncbi:hypothetical protein AAG906_031592 [Vitis piasezkii]